MALTKITPRPARVQWDRRHGRPSTVRVGGRQLTVTGLDAMRDETAAYPADLGPRITYLVETDGGWYQPKNEAFVEVRTITPGNEPVSTKGEVIVKRIVDAVKNCERDPVQLRNVGLAGLGFEANTQSKGDLSCWSTAGMRSPTPIVTQHIWGPLALFNFVHPSA